MTVTHLFRRGILFAALLPASLFAQKTPAAGVHEMAQLVDAHYNQLHSLKAQFAQTYEGMGISRSESGTLLLQKPGRMRWDYSSPAGKLFLLDGKSALSWTPGNAQAQRIPARQLDDLRSPLSFLLGHTQLEKELTGLTLTPGGEGTFILSGVPKGQQNRVRKIKLAVTATGVITGIDIEETDGALTHFTFSNEQANAPIPDKTFQFTPPAGVKIVDGLPPT